MEKQEENKYKLCWAEENDYFLLVQNGQTQTMQHDEMSSDSTYYQECIESDENNGIFTGITQKITII